MYVLQSFFVQTFVDRNVLSVIEVVLGLTVVYGSGIVELELLVPLRSQWIFINLKASDSVVC